jgi:hypothetical protein
MQIAQIDIGIKIFFLVQVSSPLGLLLVTTILCKRALRKKNVF